MARCCSCSRFLMAILFVDSAGVGGSVNSTTFTLTTLSPSIAGNLLIIASGYDPDTVTITGITDDATPPNTWVHATGAKTNGTVSISSDIWYSENCKAGAMNYTITFDATASHGEFILTEYSGVRLSGSLDSANNIQAVASSSVGPSL